MVSVGECAGEGVGICVGRVGVVVGFPRKVMKNTLKGVRIAGVENHDSLHLGVRKKEWFFHNFCRKKRSARYLSEKVLI